jgi:hypothetical protein
MAQRFKAKTLLSNSGIFNNEVIAPNLVYNTGNQTISGTKTFAGAVNLDGINDLNLSGVNITITNGNVLLDTISGNFDLDISTSHDLTLTNNIGALLGFGGEEKTVTLSGDEASFHFTYLDIYSPVKIREILNGYTGIFEKLFANNLVYNTGNQNISGIKNFYSRPTVNGTGVLLSGEAAQVDLSSTVRTTGAQTVSGVKTFADSGVFSLSGIIPLNVDNNPLSVVGSGNTYVQVNIQNRATGTTATADLVITANNGTDSANFINLGINNSGYNDPTFSNGSGLDGYLFVNGGSLDIGTQTTGTNIEFHIGGTTAAKTIARINEFGLNIVSGTLTASNILYNTGNQTISGIKSFATGIDIINSGNPQNLRVFNKTGTNTGEFGIFGWSSNQLIIGSQNTDSGIFRDVTLTGNNININASGALIINNTNPVGSNSFIIKDGNGNNGLTFNPAQQGNAGLLNVNWISTVGVNSQGDYDLRLAYGGGGTRSITFFKDVTRAILDSNGNFGIGSGISSVPSRFYVSGNSILQGDVTVSGNTTITGHLSAASKSFLIDHPTQVGKKLQYGSLESPYHGIRLTDKNKISADLVKVYLPDYISSLVNDDKVNIQVTNINHDKVLFVKEVNVNENNFTVGMNRGWFDKNEYEFYWSFTAERKDIPKLTVEF